MASITAVFFGFIMINFLWSFGVRIMVVRDV